MYQKYYPRHFRIGQYAVSFNMIKLFFICITELDTLDIHELIVNGFLVKIINYVKGDHMISSYLILFLNKYFNSICSIPDEIDLFNHLLEDIEIDDFADFIEEKYEEDMIDETIYNIFQALNLHYHSLFKE